MLATLVENSFYLAYYSKMQPSEVNNLTTYEYKRYIDLLNKVLDSEDEKNKLVTQSLGLSHD